MIDNLADALIGWHGNKVPLHQAACAILGEGETLQHGGPVGS